MIFTGNAALVGGGMYTNISSHPTLDNVTFSANSAVFGGGMANNDNSFPTLTNVTFQGNTASGVGAAGGAMFNWTSNPTVYNGTFSGNTAVDHGGGIYNFSNSMPFFYDSVLWDGAPDEVYNDTSTPTIFDSIVKGGCPASSTCMNVLNANPVLGPLQNNGGFTKTMALGSGSPAIDKGSNLSCAVTDQRGVARPQGGKCDLGAYEVKTKTFRSVGASDGWVLESSENSSVGGSMNASATTLRVGDDAANRQYRGVLSFNTSPLPDAAAVVLAKVSVEKQGLVGTNPFTTHSSLLVDVVKPFFGAGVALAISDFQAAATASAGGSIGSVPSGAWYNGTLNSAGRAAVNKTGTTQLRLRFKLDDNNDHGADYLSFFSGNAPASPDRPLLLVYYNP
jgi:hypothetical protein